MDLQKHILTCSRSQNLVPSSAGNQQIKLFSYNKVLWQTTLSKHMKAIFHTVLDFFKSGEPAALALVDQ